jgi:hypothetical protein
VCNRDRSFDIGTKLLAGQPGNRGLNPGRGKRHFSSPQALEWLWGPISLLYDGFQGSFPEVNGWGVKLTTQLHLVSRLRMAELCFHFSIRLNGVVLKYVDNFTFKFTLESALSLEIRVGNHDLVLI